MNQIRQSLRSTVLRSLAVWATALTVLSGCATSSAIQRLGESESNFRNPPQLNSHDYPAKDVYRVYEKGATGFDTIEAIRARLEIRIREFADRLGKTYVVLGEQSSHPPFILGNFPRLEIVFALTDRLAGPTQPSYPAKPLPGGSQIVSSGTGFFITRDGYLITNDHVVRGAAELKVIFGKTTLSAALIKNDPANDLALLKVEGTFEPLALAPSRGVKLGDPVLTIGFPRPGTQGLEPKLSKGDISGTSGLHDNPNQFQISNPIQPGNSGGALVNASGDVVGVIVSTLNPLKTLSDSATLPQNVNFAVKSTYVTALLESVGAFDESTLINPNGKERLPRDVIDQAVAATVQVVSFR
jgi:S1-C subfamily serine protease